MEKNLIDNQKMAIATITRDEISKFTEIGLSNDQLNILLKPTPKKYVKTRQGKGGQKWDYITGGYVTKVLNLAFGWDWDFKVIKYEFDLQIGQAFVHGRLTVRIGSRSIKKEQFGRVDIKFRKGTDKPLDLGNDLKAATTDSLKKCASLIGVANDIYNKEDFAPVMVVENQTDDEILDELKDLYDRFSENLKVDDQMNIERIIEQTETTSYKKAITLLKNSK